MSNRDLANDPLAVLSDSVLLVTHVQERIDLQLSGPAESDWHQIGSIYDPPQEEMKQSPGLKILNHTPDNQMSGQGNTSIAKGAFSVRPSVPASFSVTWRAKGIGSDHDPFSLNRHV